MNIKNIFKIYLCFAFGALCDSRVVDIFNALERSLSYASKNNVTLNLILGVAIVEGQILEILSKNTINRTKDLMLLKNLLNQCQNIRDQRKEYNNFIIPYSQIVQKSIFEPELWQNNYFRLKFHPLTISNGELANITRLDEYLKIADLGEPTEFNSERCLAELFNARSKFVSQQCLDIMYPEKPSYGYHLTHKLIFFTIMQTLNLTSALPVRITMSDILFRTCSKILDEMSLIRRLNYPEILRDLLMEQMFVCGFHGFSEFLTQNLILKIMEWNNKRGYFTPYTNSSGIYDADQFAEVNHMTGLGIALLGLIVMIIAMYNFLSMITHERS